MNWTVNCFYKKTDSNQPMYVTEPVKWYKLQYRMLTR